MSERLKKVGEVWRTLTKSEREEAEEEGKPNRSMIRSWLHGPENHRPTATKEAKMITREKFVYDCIVLDVQTGNAEEYAFETYWAPDKIDLANVARAAAAEAGYVAGKVVKQPVSAALRA